MFLVRHKSNVIARARGITHYSFLVFLKGGNNMEQNTTSVVIEQQGENKKRGALAVILAVAFVAMLGIGSTFAYMSWTGNQTPNRFTVDKGLTVDLVEPAWTKAAGQSTGYPNVASDGITTIPAAANNFGTVNTVVAKDPYVVNTSMVGNEQDQKGVDAYVGIRLTLQKWVSTGENNGKTGAEHHENGHYVTMTDSEAMDFFKCYNLNLEQTDSDDATKIEKTGVFVPTLGEGWSMAANGTVITDLTANFTPSAQMYFVYKYGISSVGSAVTGEYEEAQEKAAAGSEAKGAAHTTTNLFKQVQLIDAGDALGTFINDLKVKSDGTSNPTTDPGFRILVDTAAVECVNIAESIENDSKALSQLSAESTYAKVREDGASPKANSYVKTENGVTSSTGSGYGTSATNAPESYWGWNSETTDKADTSVD
jgi:hypothetical protein